MKRISDLINSLQELLKSHGDLLVITAEDDEENGYDVLYENPVPGWFADGEFVRETEYEDYGVDSKATNVVLLK